MESRGQCQSRLNPVAAIVLLPVANWALYQGRTWVALISWPDLLGFFFFFSRLDATLEPDSKDAPGLV